MLIEKKNKAYNVVFATQIRSKPYNFQKMEENTNKKETERVKTTTALPRPGIPQG